MRRRLVSLAIFVLAFAAFAATAHAAKPRSSCANGFEAFAVPQTEADLREFSRIDAGLSADPAPYTVAELLALSAEIDANDDGFFCLKAVSQLRGSSGKSWAFFYLGTDNKTGARA